MRPLLPRARPSNHVITKSNTPTCVCGSRVKREGVPYITKNSEAPGRGIFGYIGDSLSLNEEPHETGHECACTSARSVTGRVIT